LPRESVLAEVPDEEQAARALSSLIADGLVVEEAAGLRLP